VCGIYDHKEAVWIRRPVRHLELTSGAGLVDLDHQLREINLLAVSGRIFSQCNI
jgi:hypothetical protein